MCHEQSSNLTLHLPDCRNMSTKVCRKSDPQFPKEKKIQHITAISNRVSISHRTTIT